MWREDVQDRVEALLDSPEPFRAWLERLPAGPIVGDAYGRQDSVNPIARFLYAQKPTEGCGVRVGRNAYTVGGSARAFPLPAWAVRFAERCGGGELDRLAELAERLRARWGERGLRVIADETGVSPSSLSRAENGKPLVGEDTRRVCA